MTLLHPNRQHPKPVPTPAPTTEAALAAAKQALGDALEQGWLAVIGYETDHGAYLPDTRQVLDLTARARSALDRLAPVEVDAEHGRAVVAAEAAARAAEGGERQ